MRGCSNDRSPGRRLKVTLNYMAYANTLNGRCGFLCVNNFVRLNF